MDEEIRIFVMKSGATLIGRPVWKEFQGMPTGLQSIDNPRIMGNNSQNGAMEMESLLGEPDVITMHVQPEVSYPCTDKRIIAWYIKSTTGLITAQ